MIENGEVFTTDPSPTGGSLIRNWSAATDRYQQLLRNVGEARKDLERAEKEFGDWIVPDDAKMYEKFLIWYGSSLIQVYKYGDSYWICLREKTKVEDEKKAS